MSAAQEKNKQTYKEAKKMKTSSIKVMTSFFCATVLLSPIFTEDTSQAAFAAKKSEKVSLPVTSRTGLDSSKLDKLDDLMLRVMKAKPFGVTASVSQHRVLSIWTQPLVKTTSKFSNSFIRGLNCERLTNNKT